MSYSLKKIILMLFSSWLFSCSMLRSEVPESSWSSIVYEGLDQEISAAEIPGAVDCGYYDLSHLPEKKRNALIERQLICAKRALEDKKPFKVGFTYIPIDSYATEIYLSQEVGVMAKFVDVMVDHSDSYQETKVCETFEINISDLEVDLDRCQGSDG